MKCFVIFIIFVASIQCFQPYNRKSLESDLGSAVQQIDKNIVYGQIIPYVDEWKNFFKPKDNHVAYLSPFQMWFRCVGSQVRGYLFVEPVGNLTHDREAAMKSFRYIEKHIKITADGEPVYLRGAWHGGADFYFNISSNATSKHKVDIAIQGFRHYTRFPISNCIAPLPISSTRKYVMHVHLKEFADVNQFDPELVNQLANHLAYHRCALKLDKYEVVIQREHLPLFASNPKIAHAVKEGWITFILRNPTIPSPIFTNLTSNYYHQAYTENMALLQHWQENVKIYFFDSDEYLNVGDDVNGKELIDLVETNSAIGFVRYLTFCDSCPVYEPEAKHLSLTKSSLSINDHKLRDAKLVVDPNRVGCFIIHWAGCGDRSVRLPKEKAVIMLFDNMNEVKWHKHGYHKIDLNGIRLRSRLKYGNETKFIPSSLVNTCDPVNYDWKSSLPSFHAN